MDELKLIFASNLIALRTAAAMTQTELGQKLNYSDKSISKWERGEAIPDAWVLKQMAALFGTTVDELLTEHDEWKPRRGRKMFNFEKNFSSEAVVMVSIAGIWTLALMLFVVFWLLGSFQWCIFAVSVPASLATVLVMNSIWHGGVNNMYIVMALVLSLIGVVYVFLLPYNPWQIFLVSVPAELVVFLSFRIRRRRKDR